MFIAAVICEYNPFHLGHAAQIEIIKRAFPDAAVLSLMSGSHVQRGEAAIADKYLRALHAVSAGADLVLELPFPFSCTPADRFASSAVSLLRSLGDVDILAFGSESGELPPLLKAAERLSGVEYETRLALALRSFAGEESYPRLRERIYRELYGEGYPTTPNDMLAVEYLRALTDRGSHAHPFTHGRVGSYSASDARDAIFTGNSSRAADILGAEVASEMLRSEVIRRPEQLATAILSRLRCFPEEDCERFFDADEGLVRRICKAALDAGSLAELIALSGTKKYTAARIRRTVQYIFHGISEKNFVSPPAYTALLAANGTGRTLLRELSARSAVPILTRPSDSAALTGVAAEQFAVALQAERVCGLMTEPTTGDAYIFSRRPYITD